MRPMFLAVATVFAISLVATTPSHAQRSGSMNDLFNRCVQLAVQRGYSTNDLEGGTTNRQARNFVIRCMQGKQR
jgi:hypothetical protein